MLHIRSGRLTEQEDAAYRRQRLLMFQKGDPFMAVSYKKLWKLLIDKDMKKKYLCAKAGISSSSVTKMGKNGHVTTEVLMKICAALDCSIDDITEIISD